MIAGSDYLEINHHNDIVTITIRENGVTVVAHLPIHKAIDTRVQLANHVQAATSWRPPGLIEYTGAFDGIGKGGPW